ncbi:hypothetical protein [Flavobacterium luminosum]|uniref:hypothetical protein n=1 Tax=Flavobacterium luminosum TaxID=2949086 RepID=UPI00293ECACE|nr:hypothetical protein [Flavobacterium sp. HXWNR70]
MLLLVAVALDFVYTTVFAASENRNKVEKVINSKPQNYDVIILGTSRANNHFVPELFEQQGLKTFNYGMSGSHLFEASLLLKLMVERGWDIKQILLETDLNLSNEKRDPGTSAWMMPFLHRSETIREHYYKEPDFNQLYYIPFYRYIEFDNRIGFRALWKTATQQPTVFLKNQGYYPLPNTSKGNMKNNIKALRPLRNRYYEEIKDICRKNNIQLIAVTTPMCENTEGMEYFSKVKQLYPEIREYEQAVQGDEYFSSCGHLNDRGARKFTEIIINDLLKKK